jgi:hypothetical protein
LPIAFMRSRVDRSFWKPELVRLICRCGWSMPIWQPLGTVLGPSKFFRAVLSSSKGHPDESWFERLQSLHCRRQQGPIIVDGGINRTI